MYILNPKRKVHFMTARMQLQTQNIMTVEVPEGQRVETPCEEERWQCAGWWPASEPLLPQLWQCQSEQWQPWLVPVA